MKLIGTFVSPPIISKLLFIYFLSSTAILPQVAEAGFFDTIKGAFSSLKSKLTGGKKPPKLLLTEDQSTELDTVFITCVQTAAGSEAKADNGLIGAFEKYYSCKPPITSRLGFNLFRRKKRSRFEACIKTQVIEILQVVPPNDSEFKKKYVGVLQLLRQHDCNKLAAAAAAAPQGDQVKAKGIVAKVSRLLKKYRNRIAELTAKLSPEWQQCLKADGNVTLSEFFCDPQRKASGQFMSCVKKDDPDAKAVVEEESEDEETGKEEKEEEEKEDAESDKRKSKRAAVQQKSTEQPEASAAKSTMMGKVANSIVTKIICPKTNGGGRKKRTLGEAGMMVLKWPFVTLGKILGGAVLLGLILFLFGGKWALLFGAPICIFLLIVFAAVSFVTLPLRFVWKAFQSSSEELT